MKKLVLGMFVSLDGFVATTSGDNSWIFEHGDDAVDNWIVGHLNETSYHVMGSQTFLATASYWPNATDSFAAPMNNIPKFVFSKKGIHNIDGFKIDEASDKGSWANPYVGDDLPATINKLKQEEGKPLRSIGGVGFAHSLIAADLVDEYNLLVCPVALGSGLPLFPVLDKPKKLTLVNSVKFKTGAMAHTYRRG